MLIVSKAAEVEANHGGAVTISTYFGKIIENVREGESGFCGETRSIGRLQGREVWELVIGGRILETMSLSSSFVMIERLEL